MGACYSHYFGKTDISLGVYLADSYYNDEIKYIFDSTAGTKGIFLIAGAGLILPWFDLDLAVADGHLFSGDWRKQTIVKSAISFPF